MARTGCGCRGGVQGRRRNQLQPGLADRAVPALALNCSGGICEPLLPN